MNTPTRPATPSDDRPIDMPALRPPRLPTFFADPITGVATDLSTEDYANAAELWPLAPVSPMSRAEALRLLPDNARPRPLTTEERIAELEAEKRVASYGRAQEINGELEELYIRLQYEKAGKVTL